MSAPFAPAILSAIRSVAGMGRSRVRDFAEWAAEHPKGAAVQAELWGSLLDHRIRVIQGRRFVLRGKKRVLTKLRSLRIECSDLRRFFLEQAAIPGPAPEEDITTPTTL